MNIKFIKDKTPRRNQIRSAKKVKKNNLIFLFFCFLFLIGIICGSIYFKSEVLNNEINGIETFFYNESILEVRKETIFLNIILQNLLVILFYWIIGLSIIGIPILLLFLFIEGFSLGITVSYILTYLGFYSGYTYIYVSMYIPTIINIFSIVFLCYSASCVTINILKRGNDIKNEFVKHSTCCLIVVILSVLSSFFESNLIELSKKYLI